MSRKPEIIDALLCESDLPLKQIAEALGSDWDDKDIQRDLQELVRAGVVNQKEDSVDHDWFYRLSNSWLQRFRDHVLTSCDLELEDEP